MTLEQLNVMGRLIRTRIVEHTGGEKGRLRVGVGGIEKLFQRDGVDLGIGIGQKSELARGFGEPLIGTCPISDADCILLDECSG